MKEDTDDLTRARASAKIWEAIARGYAKRIEFLEFNLVDGGSTQTAYLAQFPEVPCPECEIVGDHEEGCPRGARC